MQQAYRRADISRETGHGRVPAPPHMITRKDDLASQVCLGQPQWPVADLQCCAYEGCR
jgi:hypothetical protein